ncbi:MULTISPECIES: recombination mediator RecR [Selenomonas]|jgi:recombination protein recR|uniref:Recombination protein RecR n=1 Tax=Selenomonas sputigena (strain ATCC 35185 / DSM 20758 / CCUG 44933 / VPI D19B-28) TaxID=546271 RepID=C9LV56_SELS3|nr:MULTISPECIES: recombination mediator RecR [Selenomonas]AEB99003.1 recombination protein RecR [Selenomonas sputigena ATCC 35185]EEX77290.1 recombination protein RecR [Selenomonas sputigena ATCC 35185]EJU29973.1 recombination protein RecR [Selenomonas sp. CM52]UZD42519.1 recombination mediator RecR [Selenomonas sputigena]UZE45092.1 recombination mediator RecR [Selenomonas sputigena]
MQYIAPLAKLIEHFRALPGIGSKTAVRLAYHVLDMDAAKARALAEAIVEAREKIGFCSVCCNLSDQDPCAICASEKRDRSKICVVEQPQDVAAVERMKDYKGLYHVLHGSLSPLSGVGPENLRVKELLHRLEGEAGAEVQEIIMATNPTVEGEATAMYLARLLKPAGLKVTRIAHGLPIGGDLEYADEVTLAKALENRKEI